MNKLNPCQICGGGAVMVMGGDLENAPKYSAACVKCFCDFRCELKWKNSIGEAVLDWNRRANNAAD